MPNRPKEISCEKTAWGNSVTGSPPRLINFRKVEYAVHGWDVCGNNIIKWKHIGQTIDAHW
jgi:hypothetical protein